MSAKTGIEWKAKRVASGPLDKHLGGMITTPETSQNVELTQEPATGQYQLAVLQPAAVMPRLRLPIKVQRLEDYIADYSHANKFCFASAEAAIAVHDLFVTDGLDPMKWADSLVNSCEIVIPIRGSVSAMIEVFAKTKTTQAYGSDPTPITEAPLMHTNVNTLTIGGYDIVSDFQEVRFGVAHNIQQEVLGSTLTPTEVIQRHTVYSGSITRALKTQSLETKAYGGTSAPFVIQINDNQGTPKKTKFTFDPAYIEVESKRVPGLGMILETITWRSKALVLAVGS